MTPQELMDRALNKANKYADACEAADAGRSEVPALIEAPEDCDAAATPSILQGPPEWFEARDEASDATAETYQELSSKDMYLTTLKRRLLKYLEPDDYTIRKGKNGRHIYCIREDMVGWINRRLN